MIAQSKTPGKQHEFQNEGDLSRVFVMCPKSFGEEELRAKFVDYSSDIEYVQIVRDHETRDSKGVAYVKFTKPSTAAMAIENCDKALKAVIAEPKSSRSSRQKGAKEKANLSAFAAAMQAMPVNPYLDAQGFCFPGSDAIVAGPNTMMAGPNAMMASSNSMMASSNSLMAAQTAVSESITNSITASLTNTRLFVIMSPVVTQEQLSSLFDLIPGMEYCDLKRNHSTRDSRGIAYIMYKSIGSAIYAKEKLNGFEYPPGSKLVVKFAEDHPGGNKVTGNGMPNFQSFTGMTTSTPMPVVNQLTGSTLQFSPVAPTTPSYPPTPTSSTYTTAVLPSPQPFADPQAEVAARLFVVCQPRAPPEQVLKDVFSRFGDLIDVWMVGDRNFGYAKFARKDAADAAIESLNEHEVLGMKIKVLHADPPKSEGSRKRPRV